MFDSGISFSSMTQPPLIEQLKNILSEYPDGGQILKELIQNAEDAEATEVSILYDGRCINDQHSGSTQTYNKFFKGPALCVFNDAIFTDKDWDGIRRIYGSVKAEDPLKVGRFGLGFKSVFHITDYPCVISGNTLLMIDPQQPSHRVNAMVNLSRIGTLDNFALTSEAFWAAFDNTFGMSRECVRNGYFPGTVFWFPLRQILSDLSETLYNKSKVMDLLGGFESEASYMLLFLKHLERITVCTRGNTTEVSELIKVEIKDDTVVQNRRNFKKKVQATDTYCNGEDLKNEMHISISTTTRGQSQKHDWMVVNYFVGESATADFRKLIQDRSFNYSPYVGVAAPLLSSNDAFEGHIFCVLPLPKEGSRLTGLPVHVNGYFALSQNRHHLKWETDEQKGRQIDDKAILWNKYLIAEAIPKAYEKLIHSLIARSVSTGNTPEMVAPVYSCLPISSNVKNTWSALEIELYARLFTSPLLFSKHKNKWILLTDSCFATFCNIQHDDIHVKDAVKSCLNEIGKNYVDIPSELFHTLKRHYLQIQDLTPQLLFAYLLKNPAYRNMSHDCKLDLLTYILSDGVYEKLSGLELLPLYSGGWANFDKFGEDIYLCSEDVMKILPSQEHRLLLDVSSLGVSLVNHFRQLCRYGLTKVKEMTTSALTDLLESTIKCQLGSSGKPRLTLSTNLSVQWLQNVWRYIATNGDIFSNFTKLKIVPVLKSGTWADPQIIDLVTLSDILLVRLRNEDYFPDGVCRCFETMGVTVLEGLPEWIPENLISQYCFWPTSKSAIALLSRISKAVNVTHTIKSFNQNCSWNSKVAMRTLLEKSQFEMTEEARRLIRELRIFRAFNYINEDGYDASVSDVPSIISDSGDFPGTVKLPFTCIRAGSNSFTTKLGARKLSAIEIATETLKSFESEKNQKDDELSIFMKYFVRSFYLFKNNDTVLYHARNLHFLRTGPNSRKYKAEELFDPSNELLLDLLHGESLLPESNTWNREEDIIVLRCIGLKEMKDIDSHVVLQIAGTLDKWTRIERQDDILERKARAFMQLLHYRPLLLDDICKNCKRLADCIKSLSCIPVQNKVSSYPACLKWYSHSTVLCKPSDAKDSGLYAIIGSVMPTVACKSEHLINVFQWRNPPALLYLFKQLTMIKNCYSTLNKSELMPVIKSIYEHLSKRENAILHQRSELTTEQVIWTGEGFVTADKMITYTKEDNLDLRPHFFSLPEEYSHIRTLFITLGCLRQQDIHILQIALHDISVLHGKLQSEQSVKRDRRIVCDILDRIAGMIQDGHFSMEDLDLLIMVQHNDPNKLVLRPVAECTYDDDPACFYEEHGICLVHEMISIEVAEAVGVKSITRKAALDAEELGVEEWGQKEHLTMRLSALLRDGYTDGLSVPKEFIQNADDAGATTVKFLYDERQNLQMRERVLSKGMKAFQGPALWIFNDAKFSDEDLRNITKLNAATKQRDVNKIGNFGLGFCSAYNLTDMPSFVTGSSVVFFDPHEKHLGSVLRGRGTGLKYRLPNKNLVSRHIDQFKPYDGVFGCNITDNEFSEYNGTLFRLPLRTERQSKDSMIYQVSYTHEEMIELLRMFIKTAGNMLIFSQNVNSIEIHHLKEKSILASEAELLFHLHKEKLRWENKMFTPATESVLSRMPDLLQRNADFHEIHKIIISQIIKSTCKKLINFLEDVAETSKTVWLISWAKGSTNPLTMKRCMSLEGAVPLSAIAVPCSSVLTMTPIYLKNVPGFYRDGHLFCFLPLPLPTTTGLQIHINGYFAVTSDRRQLVSVTDDDKENSRNAWNVALLKDASVLSFVHLLDTLTEKEMNVEPAYKYYNIWPTSCSSEVLSFKNAFYRHIIVTETKLFRGSQSWVTFSNVMILDPSIRKKTCWQVAFEFISYFAPKQGKTLIEMPDFILENIKENNTDKSDYIQTAVITERELFLLFLRNIQDTFWENRLDDRNVLIVAAIEASDEEVRKEMKAVKFIPTEPLQNLYRPKELIHPCSLISSLFSVDDERFLLDTKEFRSRTVLEKLVELGMNDKALSKHLLKDRCESISCLARTCCNCARQRCVCLIEYICTNDVLSQLETDEEASGIISDLYMFPILVKPKTWKFSWCADAKENNFLCFDYLKHCKVHMSSSDVLILGRSKDLFREEVCDYVGGVRCIIDESIFHSVKTHQKDIQRVFQLIQVKTLSDIPLQTLVDQIYFLSREYFDKSGQFEELRKVHGKILARVEMIIKHGTEPQTYSKCFNQLHDARVVLIGNDLVKAEQVAFCVKEEYKPILYKLPDTDKLQLGNVYKSLGVKEYFDIPCIVRTISALIQNWQTDKTYVERMTLLLVNLKDIMEKTGTKYEDLHEYHDNIRAPDTYCRLWPTHELALENFDFYSSIEMKILHKDIPPSLGETLGAKSKELKCFESISIGVSFGQHEKLVSRIQGLLKAYPCDASIMKELLQNADDAGATEIHFVKDFRTHPTQTLFRQSCEPLQGPSLCVYNNSYFTKQDLEGIHNLGQGSKSDDPNKTGQYGVGFNAVYHLTDVPAFITKGPVATDSYLIILDPLCEHVPKATFLQPGQLCSLADVRNNFPDHLLGFSEEKLITEEVGTVFRFPLRRAHSKIGNEIIDTNRINTILDSFKKEMNDAVIFLRNIKCIKISNVTSGDLIEEYCVNLQLTKASLEKRKWFNDRVMDISKRNNEAKERNLEVGFHNAIYPVKVTDSTGRCRDWLIVQTFGFEGIASKVSELKQRTKDGYLGLLPLGGVAIPVSDNLPTVGKNENVKPTSFQTFQTPTTSLVGDNIVNDNSYLNCQKKSPTVDKTNQTVGKVFCFLPLPVHTGLPVHINGHFALDHESRRELWKDGYRMDWNTFILESVIIPSWIAGLIFIQSNVRTDIEKANAWFKVNESLRLYHRCFPLHCHVTSEIWQNVVTQFYTQIYDQSIALFPYVHDRKLDTTRSNDIPVNVSNRFSVKWTYVTSATSPKLSGVFNNLFIQLKENNLKVRQETSRLIGILLKSFSMELLETPNTIVNELNKAGIKDVPISSPGLLTSFMKNVNCDIGPIGVDISESKFVTAANLYSFVSFLTLDKDYAEHLDSLPVLMTRDSILRTFSKEIPVFTSRFSKLLQESKSQFIDERLLSILSEEKLIESRVCKRFRLKDFVRMLPYSMPEDVFATGSEIDVSKNGEELPILISKKWLCLFYDFLAEESHTLTTINTKLTLPEQNSPLRTIKKFDHKKFQSNIEQLKEWSFLPCVRNGTYHCLIPLRETIHLLYLSYSQKRNLLGKALKKLCLPTLHIEVFSTCLKGDLVKSAIKMCVASLDSPINVLKCLQSHKSHIMQCTSITVTEATEIMAYFGRNLPILSENTDEQVIIQYLRQLPLFITLQGTLTSIDNSQEVIVIPKGMPCLGIQEWGNRCRMILLQERESVECVYKFLRLKTEDIYYVYGEKILAHFYNMPQEHWGEHIAFLRDKLRQQTDAPANDKIIQKLGEIPFIKVNGKPKKASQLFDPENELFMSLKDNSDFPPQYFLCDEWRHLLEKLGLICDVNDNMLVQFARQIEDEGKNHVTCELLKKSELILARFLKDQGKHWHAQTLERIKTVKFIGPFIFDKQNLETLPQYAESNSFVCFQEATPSSNCSLCWTSVNIIPDAICQQMDRKVVNELGIYTLPPVDKVLLHFQNVCDSLKSEIKSVSDEFVQKQMTLFYEFFRKHIPMKAEIRKRLQYTPFIHVPDSKELVLANEIVIDMDVSSQIPPYLFKAPTYYGKYHDLFEMIGSKNKVIFSHYAQILKRIKDKCKDSKMSPTERGIARRAIKLLLCHKMATDESINEVRYVYLPNQDVFLFRSDELVVSNSCWFESRISGNKHINFFAGLRFLDLPDGEIIDLEKVFAKWPIQLRPKMLTNIVEEVLCIGEDADKQGLHSRKALVIENFLHCEELVAALGGIMKHQFSRQYNESEFNEKSFESRIVESLKRISVEEMPSVKTVLKYNGRKISGSEETIPYHIKKNKDSESRRMIFYFSDVNETDEIDIPPILGGLIALIRSCASDLDTDSIMHVTSLLQFIHSPERLSEVLVRLRITPYKSIHTSNREYFPEPGTYVEPMFIPFLEQGIFPFEKYEYDHVAMEIEDYSVDMSDENENIPVYRYVQILEEYKLVELSGDIGRIYIVRTGNPNVYSEQVPIFRLFRFVRREDDPGRDLMKYDVEPMTWKPFDEQCCRIRNDLIDAWKLPAEDRKRVVRRLLLKWHPDKNRGNEAYCEKLFRYIKIIISRLENGEIVTENINDEMTRGPSEFSSTSSSNFENVCRKAKTYARSYYENYDDYSRTERTGRYSHNSATETSRSDSSEATRWMRQSKNDFKAAMAMLLVADDVEGFNWICYLCHQASEKALKSANYSRDANNVPRGSQSHCLTSLTSDSAMLEQARLLEARVGSNARLLYPDAVSRPKIPSDVFTKEDAGFCIDATRKIIDLVEEYIS